ncbi:hypothetical protein [Streptomyces abikoensis]
MTTQGLQGAGSRDSGGVELLAALVKAGFVPAARKSLRDSTWGDLTQWAEKAAPSPRADHAPERRLHLSAAAQQQLREFMPQGRAGAALLFEGTRWPSHVRKATPDPQA